MGKRIYPLNLIRYWSVYDIDEICSLYKKYNLHPQTVRAWINKGLQTIDHNKPSLIYGQHLKDFLGKSNLFNKCHTLFEEMFCLKCQEARKAYRRQIQLEHKNGFIKAKSYCQNCKSVMNKSYKLLDCPNLKSTFEVVDVLELYDCKNSTGKTHILDQDKEASSESLQGELFPL